MRQRIRLFLLELNSKGVFALLFFACVAYSITGHLRWSMTKSLNDRLFFVMSAGPGDKTGITKGDLVVVDVLRPGGDGYVRTVKRVACTSGQRLSVSKEYAYLCDGVLLGSGKAVDSTGRQTTRFVYDGVVPKGKVFLMGDSVDSYDSRYYGFAPVESVLAFQWGIF